MRLRSGELTAPPSLSTDFKGEAARGEKGKEGKGREGKLEQGRLLAKAGPAVSTVTLNFDLLTHKFEMFSSVT